MFSLHTVASIVNLKSHLGNVPPAKTFLKNWKQAIKCLVGKNSLRGTTKQWPRQTEFLVRTWSWILQLDFGGKFLLKFSNWISIRSYGSCEQNQFLCHSCWRSVRSVIKQSIEKKRCLLFSSTVTLFIRFFVSPISPLSNSRLKKTCLLFSSTVTLFIRFFVSPISLWFSSRVKQYFPGSLSPLIYLYQTKLN